MIEKYNVDFNDFTRRLSLNIQFQRKLADLTQEQLAEMLDVTTQYVSMIENTNSESMPSLKLLFLIAKVLNIDIKELFR